MRIRLEKRGIRALGVSEVFREGSGRKSTLAGVIIRSDLIVDGIIYGAATLEGDDATDAIIDMFRRLNRNDINVIILGGAVISLYNIIDVDKVSAETQVPVISVTFEESEGLESAIKHHFPNNWARKIETYRKLGGREPVDLKTGYRVYVRAAGTSTQEAKKALDKFTLQGALPEPIRIAHLAAKAKFEADQQHLD
ncbi:MAG: DUF99 family protein [Thaumarchaeota archaeon]|nr:DUF99 family protein [Nitrososphaerota archaeon]MCL5317307.1 DUF99 family protein [Nitrososphaerota archaeon]